MDVDAPPLTIAEQVLAPHAPELARHVHAFLHGGAVGTLPLETEWKDASAKLRLLHDALVEAGFQRKAEYVVLVLAVAVRLQAVILVETIRRTYTHAH